MVRRVSDGHSGPSALSFLASNENLTSAIPSTPLLCAMCGRLRLAREILRPQAWSVRPCVRPLGAVHTLAIMFSADQVPVKTAHSTIRWHQCVVLIAGAARGFGDHLCQTAW